MKSPSDHCVLGIASSAQAPAFDVASVKPNTSGEQMWSMQPSPGGRLSLINVPLRTVIDAMKKQTAIPVILSAILGASLLAQTAAPQFEVASIRSNKSGDGGSSFQVFPGGRFLAINASLRELMLAAYAFEYQRFQILGGEPWMNDERFNIDARAGRDMPPQEVNGMLPALLADRFKLVMRQETQQRPIYGLVVADDDRRLGRGPRRSSGDCATFQLGLDGAPVPPPPNVPQCGVRNASASILNGVRITGGHVTIGQLSGRLEQYLQRRIADDTGLMGMFEINLEFADPRRLAPADNAGTLDSGASIFTAVQEQLGLRLEPRTGPVEVLVIESAERPSEN